MAGRQPKRVKRNTSAADDPDDLPCADVDSDCLSRNVGRRNNGSWYPAGPSTLLDVIDVARKHVTAVIDSARSRCPSVICGLRAMLIHGLVITSAYSGMGNFEGAVWFYISRLAAALDLEIVMVKLVFWSATECNPTARRTLLGHRPETPCRHVFCDILDRLQPDDKEELLKIQAPFLTRGILLKHMFLDGLLSKGGLQRLRHTAGMAPAEAFSKVLGGVEFRSHDWCVQCCAFCPISPRSHSSLKNYIWIDGGGSCCQPFSAANSDSTGLLDRATLVLLVYVFSMRYCEVDAMIHECVPKFPRDLMEAPLTQSHDDLLKCPDAQAHRVYEEAPPIYKSFHKVSTPVYFGVPIQRLRMYTFFCFMQRLKPNFFSSYEDLFYKTLACNGAVFFYSYAEAGPQDAAELSTPKIAVLEGYELKALSDGLCDDLGNWNVPFALANLANVSSYGNFSTHVAPTLLCNSHLYSFTPVSRPVFIREMWLMQGIPHSAASLPCDVARFFSVSRSCRNTKFQCVEF